MAGSSQQPLDFELTAEVKVLVKSWQQDCLVMKSGKNQVKVTIEAVADDVRIHVKDVLLDINMRINPTSSKETKIRLVLFVVLMTCIVLIHLQDVININNCIFLKQSADADEKFNKLMTNTDFVL